MGAVNISIMRDNSTRLLEEKYNDVAAEGILGRTKARMAGLGGSIAGAKDRLAGSLKGAAAGARGDVGAMQAAQQQRRAGAVRGEIAKIRSYQNTALQKLTNVSNEIANDLSKLGIDISDAGTGIEAGTTPVDTTGTALVKLTSQDFANFQQKLNMAFNDLVAKLQAKE